MNGHIKNKLNISRIISAVLSVIIFLACFVSCSDKTDPEGKPELKPNDSDLLARVIMTNDVQFGDIEGLSEIMLRRMFSEAYQYSNKIDAFIFDGDITKNGTRKQFSDFIKLAKAGIIGETKLIVTFGSGDYDDVFFTPERINDEFSELVGNTDTVINGIHFIGVSSEDPYGYEYDTEWLSEHLEKAYSENPEAPIITFQHYPVSGTVFKDYNVGTPVLTEIYNKYPNIINFTGHNNFPVTHPLNIDQSVYTSIGLGSVGSYINFPDSIEVGTQNNVLQRSDAHDFVIVEVYADNSTLVTPYCIDAKSVYYTSDGDILRYTVSKPGDPASYEYTYEKIKERDKEAPVFSEDAVVSIDKIYANTCAVSFSAAQDDTLVNYYELQIIDPNGDKLVSKAYVRNLYWVTPMSESHSRSLSGMDQNVYYILKIYAYDFSGNRSEPLSIEYQHISTY